MLVDSVKYTPATGTKAAGAEEQSLLEAEAQRSKELLATLEKELEKNKKSLFDGFAAQSTNKFEVKVSKPTDNTARLTQRLVAAGTESEVSAVIAEAGQNLVSLRIVAALGKGEDAQKARAIIQRLNKLINRGSGKIRDLRGEEVLRSRSKRAAEERKNAKAEKIKAELRQKQRTRQAKENGYLREDPPGLFQSDYQTTLPGDYPSEAAIAAQAEVMAAAEVAMEAAGPGGEAAVAGGDVGAAAAGGGAEGVSGDAGAGLDISV